MVGLFSMFRVSDEEREQITECRNHIIRKVTERRGATSVFEIGGDVAFAGSEQNPKLLLSVFVQRGKNESCLGAYVDDQVSWYESDFEDRGAFEDEVANYIAPLIGRTVKTVTQKKSFEYIKISVYVAGDHGDWSLIEENVIDFPLLRLFVWKDSLQENIESYQIEHEDRREE